MQEIQQELWERIQTFDLDEVDAEFPFSKRLMRENAWSSDYARRVIEEYKRFMFMLCVADHPLTPSDQVDQVWHLHLIYTENYWEVFCNQILQRKVHHGPTKGGMQEKKKYENLYKLTQNLYLELFQQQAPQDIWYDPDKRFKEINFQRVNKHTHWIIAKPQWKFKKIFALCISLCFLLIIFVGCSQGDEPLENANVALIVSVVMILILVTMATRRGKKGKRRNSNNRGNDAGSGYSGGWFSGWFDGGGDGGDSGCGSGCSGCGGGGCGGCGG